MCINPSPSYLSLFLLLFSLVISFAVLEVFLHSSLDAQVRGTHFFLPRNAKECQLWVWFHSFYLWMLLGLMNLPSLHRVETLLLHYIFSGPSTAVWFQTTRTKAGDRIDHCPMAPATALTETALSVTLSAPTWSRCSTSKIKARAAASMLQEVPPLFRQSSKTLQLLKLAKLGTPTALAS